MIDLLTPTFHQLPFSSVHATGSVVSGTIVYAGTEVLALAVLFSSIFKSNADCGRS